MAPGDLDRLHGVHIVFQNGFDLPPAHAGLIQLKQFLCLHTVGQRVHMGIGCQIVIGENAALLGKADVGELSVAVGILSNGLFDQFPGDHAARRLIIPAVHLENLGAVVGFEYAPLINIPGGRAEGVRLGGAVCRLIGEPNRRAKLNHFFLINQNIGEGVVEYLAQNTLPVLVDSRKILELICLLLHGRILRFCCL